MLSGYHSVDKGILRSLPKKYKLKVRHASQKGNKSPVPNHKNTAAADTTAELSNLLSELTVIKDRLQNTLQECNKQLNLLQNLNQQPTFLQEQIENLQADRNFMYCTVTVEDLPFYASPSTDFAAVGHYKEGERILVLYNLLETKAGLWIQTRNTSDPEARYWMLVGTENGNILTVDEFSVLP